MRYLLSFAVLLVVVKLATAAEPFDIPIGPTPEYGRAEAKTDGELEIATVVSKPVWETRTTEVPYTVTKVIDGQSVTETRVKTVTTQVCRWVSEARMRRVAAKDCQVCRAGKKLSKTEYIELLQRATPVVISKGPLQKFYRDFFKESVVVTEMAEANETALPPETDLDTTPPSVR